MDPALTVMAYPNASAGCDTTVTKAARLKTVAINTTFFIFSKRALQFCFLVDI